jgi:hypothetical protein
VSAEGVVTPDGQTVDLEAAEQEFNRTMAAPAGDVAAPPRMSDEAKAEAKAAKDAPKRRGRPSKDERARVLKSADTPVKPPTPEVTASRSQSVVDTVSVVGTVAVTFGKTLKNDALKADGYVLTHFAKPLGDACAEVAKFDAKFAAMLDKQASGKAMAYVGLIGVGAQFGTQLAVNHGLLKPGMLGAASAADILTAFEPAEDVPEANSEQPHAA